MITLGRRIKRALFSRLFLDLAGDTSSTIFVAGTGRGGTTWVGDIVNYRDDHRMIFEPFHPEYVTVCRPFGNRPYIRPGDPDLTRARIATAILAGRLRNHWIDGQNTHPLPRRRLVKEIRANLMLKWLHDLCPRMRIVLCLRHPCAVVHSRQTLRWSAHLEDIVRQGDLCADHLQGHEHLARDPGSAATAHAMLWCIETLVPLRQFLPGELHLVFYENLCANPRKEFERLFVFLQRDFDDLILTALGRPSWVSRRDSAVAEGKDPLVSWQRQMHADDVESVLSVVRAFGLGMLYNENPMPNEAIAYEILAQAHDPARSLSRSTRASQ